MNDMRNAIQQSPEEQRLNRLSPEEVAIEYQKVFGEEPEVSKEDMIFELLAEYKKNHEGDMFYYTDSNPEQTSLRQLVFSGLNNPRPSTLSASRSLHDEAESIWNRRYYDTTWRENFIRTHGLAMYADMQERLRGLVDDTEHSATASRIRGGWDTGITGSNGTV